MFWPFKFILSNFRLKGKVTIITGVASGIGEATAKLFAEHGAFIVMADTRDDLGNQVVSTIGLNKASYRHCDVRDEKQVAETMAYVIEKYGSLDIIYSNAAVLGRPMDNILDMNIEDFDYTMAANLRASALVIKHGARAMVARNIAGSIICNGSIASSKGGSGPPAYTISKHGLLGLVRSASSELGRYGIRVNCISPFGVATSLALNEHSLDPNRLQSLGSSLASLKGVKLQPKHVAEAALFLASDESTHISGHNLVVDGGTSVVSNIMSIITD